MFVLGMKQYACPFFAKRVFTATARCTWPPKIVAYGLNPFFKTACWLLFSSFWQRFTNVFASMPNVKLMTDIGALFPHNFFYLHMPVCCNLFYINISGLHAMQNFLKTIFLHSIWISTFSELCYWHCNDFINTMFQKGICQLFCIISWAITSSVTTKCTWMWLRNFRNHFFFLIDSSFISNSK